MLSPVLFAGAPFKNPTAFADLTGSLELILRAYAEHIFTLTGVAVNVPPLGGTTTTKAWLLALQQTYRDLSAALGIGEPGDLASFDLTSQREWPSWTFSISQETERIRAAAGIP